MVDTCKVVELVGESKESWDDAIKNAVSEATRSLDNVTGVEVYNFTADIEDGQIADYKANIKVAFCVKR